MNLKDYVNEYGIEYCIWKITQEKGGIVPTTMRQYCTRCDGYKNDINCQMQISLGEIYTGKYAKRR